VDLVSQLFVGFCGFSLLFFFCLLVFGFLCILFVCLGASYTFYIFPRSPIKKKYVVRIFLKAANQTKKAALKGTVVHQTLFPLIGVKAIITTHDIEE
jgi:hypothetical protein